jgi:hypothetical protein
MSDHMLLLNGNLPILSGAGEVIMPAEVTATGSFPGVTVPAAHTWIPLQVKAILVANAEAGARLLVLTIRAPGPETPIIAECVHPLLAETISARYEATWVAASNYAAVNASGGAAQAKVGTCGMPKTPLPAGSTITVEARYMKATDSLSCRATVESIGLALPVQQSGRAIPAVI